MTMSMLLTLVIFGAQLQLSQSIRCFQCEWCASPLPQICDMGDVCVKVESPDKGRERSEKVASFFLPR